MLLVKLLEVRFKDCVSLSMVMRKNAKSKSFIPIPSSKKLLKDPFYTRCIDDNPFDIIDKSHGYTYGLCMTDCALSYINDLCGCVGGELNLKLKKGQLYFIIMVFWLLEYTFVFWYNLITDW